MTRVAAILFLALVAVAPARDARADPAYPAQPIRIVSGFAAGGVTDSIGRILSERIRAERGQPVTVENKPGASGLLATQEIVRARPDGYNLMVGGFGGQLIPPLVIAHYPVDVERGLTHLAGIAEFMNVMTVSSRLPITTVAEFIRYARDNPGKLSFGSAGVGSSNYLSAVLFMQRTGVEMTHVPYRGGFGPTSDLLSGTIDVIFENVPIMMGQGASDRLRYLAVTGRERSEQFPDVPTMIEAGIPDYVITSWIGIYGPPHMAPDLAERVSDVLVSAALDPTVQARMRQIGFQPLGLRSSAFMAFFLSERARWKEVVETAGIRIQQ